MSAFDSATWKDFERAQREPYARRALADRLVEEHLLDGKSKAEVIELLGEPTETKYFGDWDVVYWVGPQRGLMAIDSEWLVVRFDDSDRVSEYAMKTD